MSTAVNIGIFGRRNVGKSSLINTLAGQEVAIVSDHPGTTTDPVRKRMEIFGLGPCVLIDTAGIDDDGSLGRMRVARTEEVTAQIDIALLLFSASDFGKPEEDLMDTLTRYSVPVVLIHSKSDISSVDSRLKDRLLQKYPDAGFQDFSSSAGILEKDSMIQSLLETVRRLVSSSRMVERPMFDGIVSAGQRVLLVCPIDSEAPTGRLILPQVNAIRSLLDIGAIVTVVQPAALPGLFRENGERFDLVVTDSQAFSEVASAVPEQVPLTSFSMLLARSKGCFDKYIQGTPAIDRLEDGDRVLILESCSHHSSCEDIGRVKIPALLRRRTGKNLVFDVVGGLDGIGRPVTDYALVLQCGGCMITRRQLYSRLLPAIENDVPVSNYGMAISYMKGIYERALRPLLR
ncbi:small GTP-binding protein [Alistipes sp. CAG:831]|nr:small GTP-binding protein [Alistipes sp. CAG:831]